MAATAALLNPIVIKKPAFLSANFSIRPSLTSSRRKRKVVIMMMGNCNSDHQISVSTSTLQIRLPSTRNKVFEDASKGIVCYRDENGEITCEGIDEGPRFCHSSSASISNNNTIQRYTKLNIIHLLLMCI
ncbi:OLC1v1015237C1 [Oldenlandia corymbosa var. corymbosa]|uniref:OLC1v1015237C1 n=1 Tax=Oldenlandia corymbosa var. corymbosa TaxID=529605 RepID=A0AAV1E3J0_OLDCO|nr:OLC1v1015237C1 [Oldenlandia corymbosa var. corymbosa]